VGGGGGSDAHQKKIKIIPSSSFVLEEMRLKKRVQTLRDFLDGAQESIPPPPLDALICPCGLLAVDPSDPFDAPRVAYFLPPHTEAQLRSQYPPPFF
jgi:hypothetical protein